MTMIMRTHDFRNGTRANTFPSKGGAKKHSERAARVSVPSQVFFALNLLD